MYKIVRFYHPSLKRAQRVIERGLTEEEARQHCTDPRTRKTGEYFDGFQREED
jgi:hypothetical protein